MENEIIVSKTAAQCAEEGGWCDKLVEEQANYYKNILRECIPYMQTFIDTVKYESASTLYHEGKVIHLSELESFLNYLKSESYGAK